MTIQWPDPSRYEVTGDNPDTERVPKKGKGHSKWSVPRHNVHASSSL